MGRWYNPKEWFRKFSREKDLREVCREKYGDDFVEMYDMLNNGVPIGNLKAWRCLTPAQDVIISA